MVIAYSTVTGTRTRKNGPPKKKYLGRSPPTANKSIAFAEVAKQIVLKFLGCNFSGLSSHAGRTWGWLGLTKTITLAEDRQRGHRACRNGATSSSADGAFHGHKKADNGCLRNPNTTLPYINTHYTTPTYPILYSTLLYYLTLPYLPLSYPILSYPALPYPYPTLPHPTLQSQM